MSEAELCARIAASGAFDGAWYMAAHSDVAASGIDPVLHYVRFGRREKRAVNPEFKLAARDIFSLREHPSPVNVVFAANDKYVPYLSVAIASLIENADVDTYYDINILHDGISLQNLDLLQTQATNNISITSHIVSNNMKELTTCAYVSPHHISIETYFRFAIPLLFPQWEKCVYLDCDLVLNRDISYLYTYDIGDKLIGAVEENSTAGDYINYRKIFTPEVNIYFNAGVLLINVSAFVREHIFDMAKKYINENIKFPYMDQDILNKLCNGNVLLLPCTWNFMWQFFCREHYKLADRTVCREYMRYFSNPAIVHYNSSTKPWNHDDGHFSTLFWRYARLSPWINALADACPYDLAPIWQRLE